MLTLASVTPLLTRVASSPRSGGSRNHGDVTSPWSEPLESHIAVVAATQKAMRVFSYVYITGAM